MIHGMQQKIFRAAKGTDLIVPRTSPVLNTKLAMIIKIQAVSGEACQGVTVVPKVIALADHQVILMVEAVSSARTS